MSNGIHAQLKVLSNGSTRGGQSHGALRIETDYKYIDIGCKYSNGWHSHFYTNSLYGYWFNNTIQVQGGMFSSYNSDLILGYNRSAKVWVKSDGDVGIGDATPSYKLDVNGDIATYGVLRISSDSRLKKDIKDIQKDKVSDLYDLKGKTYYKKKKEKHESNMVVSDSTS